MSADAEEIRLWEKFLALTERQSALIRDEDADGLLAAIAEREIVIAKINEFRKNGGAESDRLLELRETAARLNSENEEKMRDWLAGVNGKIKQMMLSRRGIAGYGRGLNHVEPDFLDKSM